MLSEKAKQKQGSDWRFTHTANYFNDSGATGITTFPGALTASGNAGTSTGTQLYYTQTKAWSSTSSSYVPAYNNPSQDTAAPNSSLKSFYAFFKDRGWQQSAQETVNQYGTGTSAFTYDHDGAILSVARSATGYNAPDAFYSTDISGQVVRRWEAPDTGSYANGPRTHTYRFGGREMGTISNDGSDNVDFVTLINARDDVAGSGMFRGGATTGTAFADFDANHRTLAGGAQGAGPGSHVVQAGETLQGIAAAYYGDAGLWYKIAEATVSRAGRITAGRRLTVPRGSTTHPQREHLHPLRPRPSPRRRRPAGGPAAEGGQGLWHFRPDPLHRRCHSRNLCVRADRRQPGRLGFNNLIGVQNGFSWKSLGLSVLSSAVTAGVGSALGQGAMLGSQILGDVIRGAASSAITQGIATATGLQDNFSWVGVATAGIGAGVGGAVLRGLSGNKGSYDSDRNWN